MKEKGGGYGWEWDKEGRKDESMEKGRGLGRKGEVMKEEGSEEGMKEEVREGCGCRERRK